MFLLVSNVTLPRFDYNIVLVETSWQGILKQRLSQKGNCANFTSQKTLINMMGHVLSITSIL